MPKFADLLGIVGSTFTIGSGSLSAGLRRLAFRSGSFLGTIDWTLTANRSITLPDKDGTIAVSEFPASATFSVPLQGSTSFPTHTVAGAVAFTLGSSIRSAGAETTYRLVANGTNIPTFTGFTQKSGSLDYDNRSGNLNLIEFLWDGVTAWYSISRAITVAQNWTNATFQNGFTNFGGGYQAMQFLSFGGRVYFRGFIQKAWPISVETVIFAIPSTIAPTSRTTIPVVDAVAAASYRVDVLTNGNVVLVPFGSAPSTGTCFPTFSCSCWLS